MMIPVLLSLSAHADDPCEAGKVRTEQSGGQCCWPGQTWSEGACRGTPTACPEGLLSFGESCGSLVGATGIEVGSSQPRPRNQPAPEVTLSGLDVGEGLAAAEVEATLTRHLNQISYCYHRQLNQGPVPEGTIRFSWDVMADGRAPESSVVEDTIGDASVASCIQGRLLRFAFPAPEQDEPVTVAVTYGFAHATE